MALMARRLAAELSDMAPLMVALPLLAVIGLQGYESLLGEGIFDPVSGGDPVIAVHLAGKRALAVGAALGALVWLAVEIQALLRRRQSIGTATAGLTLQRLDGRLP